MSTKPAFIHDEIYHVYNRGVEKRNIFMCNRDYIRFMYNIFTCNEQKGLDHLSRVSNNDILLFINNASIDTETQLVEILGFVLMPNHFHFILRQKIDGGITKFMQKIGIAYTMYFNKKYERVGSLFQGNFKAVHINTDAHFLYILHYVHLNPLSIIKNSGQDPILTKMSFLEKYKWSSLPDYLGYVNFSNIFNKKFFLDIFEGEKKYKEDLLQFIEKNTEYDDIDNNLLLD